MNRIIICTAECHEDRNVDFYSEDEDDCFIMFTTSESRCDDLFDRGLDMVAQGDPTAALSIFLETLTALQLCQYTNKLLPTLFQLGDAYRVLGETEKSREISDTVSLLQEALEDAMKEKWRKSRKSSEVGALLEQKDSGSLFLQKADVCESLAQDLEKNGDFEQALEYSESVFRIRQYTLGPQNPTTVRTLSNLIAFYARTGKTVHVTHCPDPIIFTSVIRSSYPPATQSLCTEPSPLLSTLTQSSQSPCSEPSALPSCSKTLCSEAPTSTSHTAAPPTSCGNHNVFSLDSLTPRCLQASPTTTSQEVYIHSQFSSDKLQLECSTQCGLESSTAAVSHHSFSDTANPVSYYTLLIAVSIIAVTALSFYI